MSDQIAGTVHGDERHVSEVVQMTTACSHDAFGLFPQYVVHDGEVVAGKIPDHTDVVLEKTEIDARRIEVIQGAQSPVIDQFTDLSDRAAKQEGVVHHNLEVPARRELDQGLRLRGRGRKRLFHEYVFSILQGSLCNVVMRPNRGHNCDRIDIRRVQHF